MRRSALFLLTAAALQATSAGAQFAIGGDPRVNPEDFTITTYAGGLNFPVGMAELDDGSILTAVANGPTLFGSASGTILRLVDDDGDAIADRWIRLDGEPGRGRSDGPRPGRRPALRHRPGAADPDPAHGPGARLRADPGGPHRPQRRLPAAPQLGAGGAAGGRRLRAVLPPRLGGQLRKDHPDPAPGQRLRPLRGPRLRRHPPPHLPLRRRDDHRRRGDPDRHRPALGFGAGLPPGDGGPLLRGQRHRRAAERHRGPQRRRDQHDPRRPHRRRDRGLRLSRPLHRLPHGGVRRRRRHPAPGRLPAPARPGHRLRGRRAPTRSPSPRPASRQA